MNGRWILWCLLALIMWPVSSYAITSVFVKASTQGSCSNSSSCATSFGTLPVVGNGLGVMVACWNASGCGITSVVDNQTGHTYTTTCATDTSGKTQACIAKLPRILTSGGTFTVTANAASSTFFELVAVEFTNTGATDASSPGSSATGTADTGVSGATVQADEIAFCVMAQSSNQTNIAINTPTGYTRRGVQQNAVTTIAFEASTKILTTTGTQQCQWTHSTTGQGGWAALLSTTKSELIGSGVLRRR